MKARGLILFVAVCAVLFCSIVFAQSVPQLINYQGRLLDDTGLPIDGTREMHFALLDADTISASVLWSETQSSVSVNKGIYHVLLGSMNPISPSALSSSTVFLEVKVGGELLAPRQRMTSVPFAMKALNADLEARVAALEDLLSNVTKVGDEIYFTGVNVNIRSGTGLTDGDTNGLGNLIVGYNEDSGDTRTGSHNLIVGPYHSYSSYGGLLAGYDNAVSGIYASVSGGALNTASGTEAVVSGGNYNIASGHNSVVVGGGHMDLFDYGNEAFADWSVVVGGWGNLAGDTVKVDHDIGWVSVISGGINNSTQSSSSSVSGGRGNIASGYGSSVSGGVGNTASGQYSSVSGGMFNEASGNYSSVSGGRDSTASGIYSSVSGGRNNTVSGELSSVSGGVFNTAFADYSSILGGSNNLAGDPARVNHMIGFYATVGGGNLNTASGGFSSVSGGNSNEANHSFSTVSGGNDLATTADYDHVP